MGKSEIHAPGVVRRLVYYHCARGKIAEDIFARLFEDSDSNPIMSLERIKWLFRMFSDPNRET